MVPGVRAHGALGFLSDSGFGLRMRDLGVGLSGTWSLTTASELVHKRYP